MHRNEKMTVDCHSLVRLSAASPVIFHLLRDQIRPGDDAVNASPTHRTVVPTFLLPSSGQTGGVLCYSYLHFAGTPCLSPLLTVFDLSLLAVLTRPFLLRCTAIAY